VTTLPSGVRTAEAWTRVQWIERTVPVWSALIDPVAARVVGAMGGAMGGALGGALGGLGGLGGSPGGLGDALPEQLRGAGGANLAGPLLGMLGQMGGLMFGAQVGQGIGSMAGEVLTSTDVGLPLGPAGVAALLPANLAAFGQGLSRPADEVRLFLALREAAHHRLFGHVPWLRQHLLDSVDTYARGITIDSEAIERALGELDPTNMDPERLQAALGGGMFQPETTDAQRAALARLETALALVEGWVDEVVASAAEGHLPGAGALRETLRRRRATGGPAEQTFATLVGLELRPRRLRDAAALWRALAEHRGMEGRDALWGHPDLLPSGDDLDDPEAFARRNPGEGPSMDELTS